MHDIEWYRVALAAGLLFSYFGYALWSAKRHQPK